MNLAQFSVILCPKCSAPMKQRTAKQGALAGQGFWGCTKYPQCKGTRKLDHVPDSPKKVDEVTVQKITNGPSFKDLANDRKRNAW